MHTIRNTLVVMDVKQPEPIILNRAKLIASSTQSHLHLLICDKKNDADAHLQAVVDDLRREGFSVTGEQAWSPCEHRTIIAVQQAQGCGLVIKQHRPDNPLLKTFLPSEDWKLLRHCPCPVLIVKSAISWLGGSILAAIDAGNEDISHRLLHAGIVGHGYDIARMTGGTLHLMSAYPCPQQMAGDPVYQVKESIRSMYVEHCKALQAEFNIEDVRLHIEEGPAESLIPAIARRFEVALCVIGSVGRSGLSGALIGNTAETVLDSLDCDVLVLKPEDVLTHLEELEAPVVNVALSQAIHSWPYSHSPAAQESPSTQAGCEIPAPRVAAASVRSPEL
ncbi:universal stress protein UspA [Pseudomonas sp. AOB-7]|nr:universal stress protein UspA [Pseudomonas sp. AOB-7]